MTVTSVNRPWFGASVCGPAHRRAGVPKQDAWKGFRGRFGSLVVVADGLGSRAYGREGALAACRAAYRAVRELGAPNLPQPESLFRLLERTWLDEIAPRDPGECSTTVLFSLIHPSGATLLGQIGDGLIVVGGDTTADVLGPEDNTFGNETSGLGMPHLAPVWHSRLLPSLPASSRILLATDGVSDDLHPRALSGFIAELDRDFGPFPPGERHRRLCAALRDWPTAGHYDDKTLALHWRGQDGVTCL
ncbi:PP2C family serine/threonine-protein phosphatase [Nonomuraea sp. NPDC048901]|uniref:PP2C family serine/threonine-protein phosphatase n=1 Tax=Nonomuraea sp. NPDC048901 TaxID=3155627 RepID=UPI00340B30CD